MLKNAENTLVKHIFFFCKLVQPKSKASTLTLHDT